MSVVRVIERDRVRPLHVVLSCLVAATAAGSCLLTCGPRARLEGSKDWREESPLRAIVGALNLGYTQTTAQGIEIKSLVFGLGAGLAAAACGVALLFRPRAGDEVSSDDTVVVGSAVDEDRSAPSGTRITPLTAAQALMVAYLIWSLASALWSEAPGIALTGSVGLAVGVVWALAIGRGMGRPAAAVSGTILLCVCTVTAILAIAYFDERNPTRRASYPIGNPLFLAACLIPGVLLSVGLSSAAARSIRRRPVLAAPAVACAAAMGAMLYAISLTEARSGAIALLAGAAALVFFAVPRRMKWVVGVVSVALFVVVMAAALPRFTAPSATGRDASLRTRYYAWSYAVAMIADASFLGQGQGAYTRLADAAAADDVLNDPAALEARLAHAHNEWLEVGADLGGVGVTLVLGSLALTVWAGTTALAGGLSAFQRWTLVALLAALVALTVEECADVALRIAGMPTVFFTVLGLAWALSQRPAGSTPLLPAARPWARRTLAAGALAVGTLLGAASTAEFQSARASYKVSVAFQTREYEGAVNLAEQGARYTLAPQRRLEAMERLCSIALFVAREYQSAYVNRLNKARSTDPPDARLLQLAAEDRAKSEHYIQRARETLQDLVRKAPHYYGAGWLEYRLHQLGRVFAQSDGEAALAASKAADAARALAGELKRRPFDPLIAVNYVEVDATALDLADKLTILARPLRFTMLVPEYNATIQRMAENAPFDDRFAPIWNTLIPTKTGEVSDDPFAPEKLRLAALIRMMRADYAGAFEAARLARRTYETAVPAGTLGAAACLLEMADYGFAADPARASESVAYVRQAIASLPPSTPGRAAAAVMKARLVTLLLAANGEPAARTLVKELNPQGSQAFVDSEIGRQYALLCTDVIHRSRGGLTGEFERWVDRAMALRPRDELVWRLRAQVTFDRGQLAASVDCLRQALEFGADPRVVYSFVQLALRLHADSPEYQALESELRELLIATGSLAPPHQPLPSHPPPQE